MKYQVNVNGKGYHDYVIKEDGTLVTNRGPEEVLITHICVMSKGPVTNNQCFALFALIMQLHKELSTPDVVGGVSWDDIVQGAK